MESAQQFLRLEISRLGGRELIVSTNIPVRRDGGLYADWMNRRIDDPGVAIYFRYKDKDITMCCDKFLRVWENIYALAKGIEALRAIERYDISEFLDRSFTGFKALPESIQMPDIWLVLGLNVKPDNVEAVHSAYKRMAHVKHPDKPTGSKEDFQQLQQAYNRALLFYK